MPSSGCIIRIGKVFFGLLSLTLAALVLEGCASEMETASEPMFPALAEYSCTSNGVGVYFRNGTSESAWGTWEDFIIGDFSNPVRGQTDPADHNITYRLIETVAHRDPDQMRNMPPAGTLIFEEDLRAFGQAGGYSFTEAASPFRPNTSQLVIDVTEKQITFPGGNNDNLNNCNRVKNGAPLPAIIRQQLGELITK